MARGLRWIALLGLAALPAALADVTCVDNASDQTTYTSANGDEFTIMCGVDYVGGDLSTTTTDTFAQCIEACSTTSGCIDVSYAAPSCYMKSALNDPVDGRSWVWTAKQVLATPPLSCVDNASDGLTYHGFTITCSKDYAGGDLMGISTASFEDCIQACEANTECVNVAYVYGACYLKSVQMPAVDNTAVWGAIRSAPTGCEITSVVYGVNDVTSYATTNWQSGDNIEIDTDAIIGNAYPASEDPLDGSAKSIFVLYTCAGETRSWVGADGTGSYTLTPGDISTQPSSTLVVPGWVAPNGNTWITIVEVAYGLAQSRDQDVWDTIYNDAWNSEGITLQNELFTDSWYLTVKSGVIWYKDNTSGPNGPLRFASGVEGSTVTLPGPSSASTKRRLVGRHFRL
jgi:hypothetical protein